MPIPYALYIGGPAVERAQKRLQAIPFRALAARDEETVVAELVQAFEIPSVEFQEKPSIRHDDPDDLLKGFRAFLAMDPAEALDAFLDISPSSRVSEPPDIAVGDGFVTFRSNYKELDRHINAVKANVLRRNADIEQGRAALVAHMTNVARHEIGQAKKRVLEEERAREALAGMAVDVIQDDPRTSRAAANPPPAARLYVIQDDAARAGVLAILREIERELKTILDTKPFDEDVIAWIEEDLFPSVTVAIKLLSAHHSTAEQVEASRPKAAASMGRLRGSISAVARVGGPLAQWATSLRVFSDELGDLVPWS